MWYLTSENDDRVIYIISQAEPVIIGRSIDNQVCHFAIPDDPSISRKHASLSVRNNTVILQDLGSRYGTFVNDSVDKAEVNVAIQLKEKDIIKFGKMNSVWKVNNLNLNTCTSTLKGENLQKLKLTLSKLGVLLKNEWDDSCYYLTMPVITLTIKVVLALVQGSHIVTTDFWENLLESVNKFSAIPDPQKFIPAVMESTLNKEVVSFSPDVQRKSIFKDKKFIFFSRRQYDMYKPVLCRSGASPLLLAECKMTVSMLCEENIVVIQFIASAATQETAAQRNQINEIVIQLKNRGKRVIADAEIGLAILYCSTEKYCNPSFSFTSEMVKQNPGVLSKTSKVLALESQEPTVDIKHEKENLKINETYASDDKNNLDTNEKLATKRKLSEFTGDVQVNPNKKVATSCYVANIPNETTKRRLSGDTSPVNAKRMALENENNDQGSSNSSEDILMDKDKSNNMFNFINPVTNNSEGENKTKKLNLSRPQKRKLGASNESGDLFNFIQTDDDKRNDAESSKQSIFTCNKIKKGDITQASNVSIVAVTSEDISAMRGIKLKELMKSHSTNTSTVQEHSVKAEKSEDLEGKMSNLDLGNTVVIICSNLIVKKEPIKIESTNETISVKNFKKFKKVWPLRKQQISIAPTISIGDLTDSNSYSVAF
ncbi:unnamed protein product [Arctia plantaginis]|uniref:FHA domain-containing protein n=1 Tax=Arctia plantaginis TaxID=874455 RepID=A0A8S1AXH5_ARCPL|nr:unnamed protein product [Arctia plantaginis]